ncbi:hypothetical protein [Gemmobacter sp.]|uniref:hypothetical protein n=1 Tax=Gemmobacter sp. TaxID=1898957 RepID=UPI002AFF15C6|nr:hypothetical protein [Gemmobacter sp.]
MRALCLVAAALLAATPAWPQSFTTAAEIRPIIEATRAAWVALRPWDGKELLYFTHLESWRCSMAEVRFSVNSSAATRVWQMLPCLTGTAQPNAIPADRLPYTELPAGALQTVTVVVVLADGTELRQDYARARILMP